MHATNSARDCRTYCANCGDPIRAAISSGVGCERISDVMSMAKMLHELSVL